MKPSFALNITDSTIGLLHRTARGWLQVGETQFDTADLAEALGYLRGSALGLSPGGLTTKLVLPNSQIKYLELEAVGPSDTDIRNQLRAALVGRTPYNVEDLVFDWSGTGAKRQVAVVARETLDEAEAFATEHRFNPVSFVGLPAAGDYAGEPWFGATKLAATLLEKGEKVDRDQDPVQVAARDLPKSHPGAAKIAPGGAGEADDGTSKALADQDKPTRAQRRAAAAAAEQARLAETAAAPSFDAVDLASAPPVAAPFVTVADAADVFPERPNDAVSANAVWPEVAAVGEADIDVTPPSSQTPEGTNGASVTDSQAFPEVAASAAHADEPRGVADDLPPAPSAAIMAAFASRRAADAPITKRFGGAVDNQALPRLDGFNGRESAAVEFGKSSPPPLSRPKVGGDLPSNVASSLPEFAGVATSSVLDIAEPKPASAKPNTAFVTAPNIPGARKRKSLPQGAAAQPGAPDTRKSLTKPGGTFASSKQRGKPRYLGLILTGLLLLFLALIAAWSSFVVSSNDGLENGTAVVSAPQAVEPADQVATETPAIDDEMLADGQDAADFALPGATAPAAVVDPAVDLTAEAQPEVGVQAPETTVSAANAPASPPADPPAVTGPEPAPTVAAATDSPNAAPLSEAQDEIFLTAIDAPPLALDPLALPAPAAANDALPLPQLEPPPFGTVYQFDADGRIRATPEGIITPEGVRLVAGKPSLIPPARPDALIAAAGPSATPALAVTGAATAQTGAIGAAPVPFPSDPALADARPRPRPAGIAPSATTQAGDGAALEGTTATRVSSLRPLARPTAILAAGETARQSTAAASLTAQAEQAAAVEAAVQASFQPDANTSALAIAVSRRPAARPKDMSRAVEAAVAAAVRAPDPQVAEAAPEADSEPETASAAPAIPTRASVAKQATYVNAINLSKINLIGVYGSKSSPYALIRQANGRYKKVKVGDSIDGGKVAAIGTSEVRYQKSGRMISLKMPKT